MNPRFRFVLASALLVLGIGLAVAVLRVSGQSETQAARRWYLEGAKPGQADIWGHYPNSYFGERVAVGDVNGDGFDDLIVGARLASEIVLGGGEAYVVPGPLAFGEPYTMPHGAALVFQGASGYQPQIGSYVDSGDMNGDGLDDIAIGSWPGDRAYLYLGSTAIQAGSPLTIAVSGEAMALTVSPAEAGLLLCDLNGDGYRDLFVQKCLSAGESLNLKVWGVLGSSALVMTRPVTLTMPADADITIDVIDAGGISGPAPNNMACGDVDGDGYPDLAIGVAGASPAYRPGAGLVYVVRGDPAIVPGTPVTLTLPGQAGAIIEGMDGRQGQAGDQLGWSLAAADVDGDGRADLIIGAPGASGPDNLLGWAGEVYLWLGRALSGQRFKVASQASWIVYGQQYKDCLGLAIATGDFDDDALPEILLGCPNCAREGAPWYLAGRAYVLEPLQISGMMTVTAVSQLEIVPYHKARGLGQAVGAMDLDGNGIGDLVIGASWPGYIEGDLPGSVYVISYPIHDRVYLPLIGQ